MHSGGVCEALDPPPPSGSACSGRLFSVYFCLKIGSHRLRIIRHQFWFNQKTPLHLYITFFIHFELDFLRSWAPKSDPKTGQKPKILLSKIDTLREANFHYVVAVRKHAPDVENVCFSYGFSMILLKSTLSILSSCLLNNCSKNGPKTFPNAFKMHLKKHPPNWYRL